MFQYLRVLVSYWNIDFLRHSSCSFPPTTSIILKGLGLEGKLTADQIAKKWDNLRTKYKVMI